MPASKAARARAAMARLVWLGVLALPAGVAAQEAPCAADSVCKRSSSPPAEDWFRHGIEALAEDDGALAACALDRAIGLDPAEDGHNLPTFVKPMVGGVKPLPRDCTHSSAPLDKKKYFPRLYLAKAYLELALRATEAEKGGLCGKALASLAASREKAPAGRVREQVARRERIDRALEDSRCCGLLPEEAYCAADG